MATLPPSDPMGPSFVNNQFEQQNLYPFAENSDFVLAPFDGTVGQLELDWTTWKPSDGMDGQIEEWTDGLFEELHFPQLVPTATLNSVSVVIGKVDEVNLPSPHINPLDEVKEVKYKGKHIKAYKANKTIFKHTKNVMERFRSSGNRRHIVEKLVMKNEGKPFYIYGVGEALKGLRDDSATKGFIAKREKFIRNHPRL
jgi:hypothetical protein